MEITLHPTLPSQVLVGYRAPSSGPLPDPDEAQQVLTGIVKGTFVAGGTIATLADTQFPILEQDVFFNLVRNTDFTEGAQTANGTVITPVAGWTSEGPAISHQVVPTTMMRVTGAGRVTQFIASDRLLGGRTFSLRLRARASANVTLTGIRLETESGAAILIGNRNLTTVFSEFGAVATWPAGVQEQEALLVLTGHASATIEYDWVRLNEGNTSLPPDPDDPIRYEHDLAVDKPRADVVILGAPAPPQPGPDGDQWTELVTIGGTTMTASFTGGALTHLNGVVPADVPWATTTPITIGWQSRLHGQRNTYAGADLANYDAANMKLPQSFDNRFFNGGFYTTSGQPVFGHIAASAIQVRTRANYTSGGGSTETITHTTPLRLPTAPQMTVIFRTAAAPDAPTTSTNVPMRLDTVIYDKAANLFSAAWRGVWTGLETIGMDRLTGVTLTGEGIS